MVEQSGSSSSRLSMMVVLPLLGLAIFMAWSSEMRMVQGQVLSPSHCKKERTLVKNECRPIVFGLPATPACCEGVRVSHLECVCPIFTPKMATLLDVNRTVKLFQSCGRIVPRHFKCGSLDFP